MEQFGQYIRSLREKQRITLRLFCQKAELDPSNWSKIERGVHAAPKSKEVLQTVAEVLEIKSGSDEWNTLYDLAALSCIPHEIEPQGFDINKLPVFFRTLRGDPPTEKELKDLISLIKTS